MAEMAALEASATPTPSQSRTARILLRIAGALLVGIGVLGIFLPLLPTTIFLLGAAACFGRSSPGAYRWLTTNRFFGRYLRDYKEEHGATLGAKMFSVGSLWIGIGAALWFMRGIVWVEVALVIIALAVTLHLVTLRTIRK